MSSLFADTHNVVAILEKSDAAEGFEQIIDFLSGSYIHYALTVNSHIYILCIKQFWNTAFVKRSNDITRLQALVDKKKIVNSENQVGDLSTHTTRFISPDLTQKDFANMRRVGKGFSGVETPLFEGMLVVRQPAEEGLAEAQVEADDVVAAAVEENIAEDGADFPTHIQQALDVYSALNRSVKNLEHDNVAQKLEIIMLQARVKRLERANKVKSSKLRRLRKVEASRRVKSTDDMEDVFNQGRMIDDMDKDEGILLVKDADIAETEGSHAAEQAKKQAEIYNLDLDHSSKVLSMQEDDSEAQEVVEVVTTAKLITDIITTASQVVIIRDPEEELSSKTPAETPKVKEKGKGILVKTPKPMKKKDQIEMDAEYARKLHEEINKDHEEFNKDINWDATMDHVNQKSKNPQFDENMRFLFKSREEMEEEDQEIFKSINETPAQKTAKRRKLSEEAQEAEDLRKRLEVVDDEDDDVFIEATPLARKVPVVDYQIVLVDNKPRFKIIKADETHQLYISFTTL
nr:hypothetical protein [Tanacetum cinerariifolium]